MWFYIDVLKGEQKLENERLRAQIREVIADVEEKKEENSDQQKYEILFTKESNEMI